MSASSSAAKWPGRSDCFREGGRGGTAPWKQSCSLQVQPPLKMHVVTCCLVSIYACLQPCMCEIHICAIAAYSPARNMLSIPETRTCTTNTARSSFSCGPLPSSRPPLPISTATEPRQNKTSKGLEGTLAANMTRGFIFQVEPTNHPLPSKWPLRSISSILWKDPAGR